MAPSHARPSHNLTTPRLILRTAHPDDAKPFSIIRTDPLNNPFGGVVNADRPESEQRERLRSQLESTARGENAFMVIILKPDQDAPSADFLKVHDGWLIGMTGYNSFTTKTINGKEILVGDTGALVDHHFARKGYALEALEALIEYGFGLGCEMIFFETNANNEPFKGLMKAMGLGDAERVGDETPGEESIIYDFGRQIWDLAKERLKTKRKWLL